jgi:hypothetical protein
VRVRTVQALVLAVACCACERSRLEPAPVSTTGEPRDLERELSALRLSDLCASAADGFGIATATTSLLIERRQRAKTRPL